MPTPRPEERFAEEVLRRVLGATVTQHDDGSSPRMVDGLFVLPDGTLGAVEVTTIGEPAALERESLATRGTWSVPGSRWSWAVYVGADSMKDLRRHLATIVLDCERRGIANPARVDHAHPNEAWEWFKMSGVRMHGFETRSGSPFISVIPEAAGGAVWEPSLAAFPVWLAARLREADLTAKIDKLRATGRYDLHLFLRVHETAMPPALYHPLAIGDSLPPAPLNPPQGLSGVWLAPRWKNPMLRWSLGGGWAREDCLD
jgi:hypothetical protein